MSGRKPAAESEQPADFAFNDDMAEQAKKIIAKYPAGRQASAVMPLLDLAQRQHQDWLPRAAMDHVAEVLSMPPIRVYEVATFYTMYNLSPVGEYFVRVCTTTPCWLRGSEEIMDTCTSHLGVGPGEITADGKFSVIEVECLGACVNAPMMQINDDYYEDLTPETTKAILDALARGEKPKAGPQSKRHTSEPAGGLTTLMEQTSAGGD